MNYPKYLASSANPESLALTVKGILTAMIPVFLIIFKAVGLDLGEAALVEFITAFTGFLSGGMILWGVIRKIYIANKK